MAKAVGNYAPSLVEVSLFGIEIDGFSKENAVTITKETVTNTHRKAMDGTTNVFLNKHSAYKVTITLQTTSGSNSWLHLIYKLYEKYGVDFKMPLSVVDKSGDSRFFCTDVYFESVPDTEFGSSISNSEWVFICHNPSYTKGGNVPVNDIIDTLQMLDGALRVANMFGVDLTSFSGKIDKFANEATERLRSIF